MQRIKDSAQRIIMNTARTYSENIYPIKIESK